MRSNLDAEPELITAQKLYDDFIDDMSNYLCDHDVVVGRETRLLASLRLRKHSHRQKKSLRKRNELLNHILFIEDKKEIIMLIIINICL